MKRAWLLGVLLLIVITACSQEEGQQPGDSVFQGGTQGLVARFEPFGVEENGIFTIFDTESFPVEVVLQNKGEEDIPAGKATVTLKGINLNDFTGIEAKTLATQDTIEGVTELNEEGGEETLDFTRSSDAKYKLPVTGFFQPDIFATADYDYKTHLAIPQVCFKEDLQDDSVCTVQEAKRFFASGAPVTVTKVEEDVAGRGIIVLLVSIENAGAGRVTLPGAEFDARFDQLAFAIETEPQGWECRSAGRQNEARLINGKAVITCKLQQPLAKDELFTKQVELTLNYRYRTVIQESVRIKESLE